MRRRLTLLAVAACLTLTNGGCLLNIWSADPNTRMQQLMNVSENLRQMEGEWQRFWFTDQPSHLTPTRIHGGIGP